MDSHLYRYSETPRISTRRPSRDQLFPSNSSWNRVKNFFSFPAKSIGSGNFYRRAVKRAKLFISAYTHKLETGCSWTYVPVVTQGLIKTGGLYQRILALKKEGRLKPITDELLLQIGAKRIE